MFDAAEFAKDSVEQLKSTIDDVAIIACSGGVDSSVAAILAKRAAGDLLHCVYAVSYTHLTLPTIYSV